MKFYYTLLFLFLFTIGTSAQTIVQWATRVAAVSSEFSELGNSSRQALYKPNVLPSGGDNPNAWRPYRPNSNEYIKVDFDLPMPIEQIAIGETYNPGSISQIFAYDPKGEEYLVFEQKPGPIREQSRLFRIFIEKTDYNVKSLKLVMDGTAIDGYSDIDCIGVSNDTEPIEASINVMQDLNTKLQVYRLNDLINSDKREIKPLLTKDGKTLYYSRRGHAQNVGGVDDLEDIWYSDFDNITQEWSLGQNVGEPLNNLDPNFISAFLQEDKEYIILGNEYLNGKMNYGISKSERVDKTTWTYPKNMKIYNDLNEHASVNFWLTPDSEILIISEEGRGTEGLRDLYVSFLQRDGVWTEPIHMGETLNTAGEEEGPFLMSDKKTLIFSSNGHSGYGKKDLFMTRRLDNTWQKWTEPENLGPVINSKEDDMFMFIPEDGAFGYFCREVEGNNLDIHSLTLPLVTRQLRLVTLCGEILDPETQEPLDSEVVFARLRDGVEVGRVRTDLAGKYCIELPAYEIYSFKAVIPGFIPIGSTIDLLDLTELNIYAVNLDRLDLDSAQLEAGLPIEVPEDVARAVAITLSLPELKRDTFEVLNAQRRDLGLTSLSPNIILSSVQTPILNVQPQIARVAAGQYFAIRNVFFDFDLSLLKQESWLEIRTLVDFMNDYPNAIVELAGHTDSFGTDQYNINLSLRRVEAVKKAVTSLGIDPERLRTKWVGDEIPIATNRTNAGRALNRRVEFQILSL